MIRGIQVLAEGMKVQMDREEVLGRNLANLRTRGYKQQTASASAFGAAVKRASAGDRPVSLAVAGVAGLGTMGTGVDIDLVSIDFGQGIVEQTGRNLDVALEGDGFLVVRTPAGDLYTRGGALKMDDTGRLVSQDGYPILGTNGEITLASSSVQIEKDGAITADGVPVEQLSVVEFQPGTQLAQVGDTLYTLDDPNAAPVGPAAATAVKGGALEASNVDDVSTMSQMVALVRQYQACQRVLQAQDELLGRATNELGRA